MGDPATDLRARVQRLAGPLGIDPDRVEVRIDRLARGYTNGLRWRACAWVSRPGRSWSIDDAARAGDEIAVDVRGVDPEDAARRALTSLRTSLESRLSECKRTARRAMVDVDVYQRALDALDALSAASKGGDRG